jgi:hypothetical protein
VTARCEAAKEARAADLAVALLAGVILKEDPAKGWEAAGVALLLGNPGLVKAVKDREGGKALRRLLLAWAEGRRVDDVTSLHYFLCFVCTTGFEEGLPLVRRLVRDKDASPVNLRAAGVAVLGRLGGKDTDAELQKLWEDESLLFKAPQGGHPARLCDQAMAASLRRAGKDPKDYRVVELQVAFKGTGGVVSLPVHWFTSDEDRCASRKRCKELAGKRD